MKRLISILIAMTLVVHCYSQQPDLSLERVLRAMIINPGFQLEFPISKSALLETYIDIGYETGYKNLIDPVPETNYSNYMILPSIGMKYKHLYRGTNYLLKEKSVKGNSGSYWGGRFLFRGKEFYSPFTRTDVVDFSLGPVWGFQRTYGNFFVQGDIGPLYYFDTKGNRGIHLLNVDIVLGISLCR